MPNSTPKKKPAVSLQTRVRELESQNRQLRRKNEELSTRLSSKRYKAMDFVVDSFYKVARHKKASAGKAKTHIDDEPIVVENRKFTPKKVDILNMNFYDWDGKTVFKGGAERYVHDLAKLLQSMGYKVRLLQQSNEPFEKTFDGIKVVGVGGGVADFEQLSASYNDISQDCEFVIASPLELACNITSVPVIGINHGSILDHIENRYSFSAGPKRYDHIMKALNNVEDCVCVDTNFINWTRTHDYELALKATYIPNYYDKNQFKYSAKSEKKKGDKLVFVYPRRLYSARGYDITIEAFRHVFEKHQNKAILNFVGQVDNDDVEADLKSFMEDYPKNVFHYEYPAEEMDKAYKDADVVLVPTRYSEGTSLSCIEAMALGKAIIATNIGGLPNLVIDNYNGRLISPTADDLEAAVLEMIEQPKQREKLANNAHLVAEAAFEKKLWEERWTEVIRKIAQE